MPPSTSSTVKPGDRFKEGIAVKVFAKQEDLKRANFLSYGNEPHVLLGRPAASDESCPADHAETQYDDAGRVFTHKDSAPHPVSWLHPA